METWINLSHRENRRAEICPTPRGGVVSNSRGSEASEPGCGLMARKVLLLPANPGLSPTGAEFGLLVDFYL
jgi:hypothetical protein